MNGKQKVLAGQGDLPGEDLEAACGYLTVENSSSSTDAR